MAPSIRFSVPRYVLASVAISWGGFLNGYDSGAIGGITAMDQFTASIGRLSPSLLGFTVALIMLTGALPSVVAGHLADRYGRLRIIAVGAVLFAVGALLQGSASSLAQFLVGRAVAGAGEGVYLSLMAVYICEIVPVKARGTLAGLPQFMSTAGICAGYFTCFGSVEMESSWAWRLPYVVQALIAVGLAACCAVPGALPESPRWLMMHGQRDKALSAVRRLHFGMDEAERDILAGSDQRPSLSLWQSIVLIFRKGYRTRTILALFILGMVQLSGIDAVIYYAPILFAQAGLSSSTSSFLASGVSAILMLAVSIPAFLLTDKWGRRTSTISGGLALSSIMFLMGILYAAGVVHPYGPARWVAIVAVFAFALTFTATWGIVGKIYAGEIQPSHTRAAANSVATGLGFVCVFMYTTATPNADTAAVHELACSHSNPYPFGQISLRCLLPFWRPSTWNERGALRLHA